MNYTNHISSPTLKVRALAGSNILDAKREAVQLSVSEWREVELVFNERKYTITPSCSGVVILCDAEDAVL